MIEPDNTAWALMIEDFKGVRRIVLAPRGVCLLAGPNGSGKTTVLTALELLRQLALGNVNQAGSCAGMMAEISVPARDFR